MKALILILLLIGCNSPIDKVVDDLCEPDTAAYYQARLDGHPPQYYPCEKDY